MRDTIQCIKKLPIETESFILSILNFCPKLLLTGSTVLHLADIMPRFPKDIDFGLTEKLTVDELDHIIDFFKLTYRAQMSRWETHYDSFGNPILEESKNIIPTSNEVVDKDLILFQINHELGGFIHLDLFNREYIRNRDIITLEYTDSNSIEHNINACHPSIAISYKARYSFDPRVNFTEQNKHRDDIKDLLLNKEKYFNVITRELIVKS